MAYGGTIKLTGETEYQKALKGITQHLREVSTEMKKTTSSYDSNDKSTSALAAKSEVLNKQLDSQKSKLKLMQDEYDRLSKTEDENTVAMSKLRSQINLAEADINKTTKEINDLGKETDDTTKSVKGAGDGFTTFKGILANLSSQAITKAISGLKTLGKAVIDIGKQAISSYAEFEQLSGGIESMFGGQEKGFEQINKVMNLSKNAWKTLTMSQNEYITAFSSTYPLMKNDIEDQNEAIEKTNRIMTLNSDLANTFGYSMEQASTAVNWALKGTYSYLDNLNIGIKGTKEGFLEAAHSVGYMVESVDELTSSDILDILEKSADKFGVLGKTAAEAKDTIQGSTKMMKSAWQNLLTAISDDTKDLGKATDEFVESVLTASKNLVPRIKTTVDGIKKLVNEIIREVFPKLKKEVPELKPLIEIFEWFVKNRKLVVGAIEAMVTAFAVNKILKFTKSMSDLAKSIIAAAAGATLDTAETNKNTAALTTNATAQVASAAATGKATTAQNLLNTAMKANPIGTIITLVTALVAATKILNDVIGNALDKMTGLNELKPIVEENTKLINDNVEARKSLLESTQKQVDEGLSEMDYYKSLADELKNIVDANGKVKEGYEARADYIINQLNQATGIEMQQIDGVIQGYQDMSKEVDNYIEKKRVQIIMEAAEEKYNAAIKGKEQAIEDLAKAQQIASAAQETYNQMNEEYGQGLWKANVWMRDKIKELKKVADETQASYEKQSEVVNGYYADIQSYEEMYSDFKAGNYDKLLNYDYNYINSLSENETTKRQQLEKEIALRENSLNIMKEKQKEYNNDTLNADIQAGEKKLEELKKMLAQYEKSTDESLGEVKIVWNDNLDDQLSEITGRKIKFKDAGNGNVQMYVDGIASGEKVSKDQMAEIVTKTINEISKQKTGATAAGEDLIDGINNGVGNQRKQNGVFSTIYNFGTNLLSSLKSSLKEHSPSKATNEMGRYLLEGLGEGIESEENGLLKQISGVGNDIIGSLNSSLNVSRISSQLQSSIPSEIDVNTKLINSVKNETYSMIGAFKEALSQMKIEMDDTEMGKFVDKTVASAIYS